MNLTHAGGMSMKSVMRLVNLYIGVDGGYLGDFSQRTHADFYPTYCDLDIDPNQFDGTTRERFIKIISTRSAQEQAKIIRGILEKYPPGTSELRTQELHDEYSALADQLQLGAMVAGNAPAKTSDVVRRAIDDVQLLLDGGRPTSAVDRVHTAIHGHLRYLCDQAGIEHERDASTTALLKKLRREHPRMQHLGPRSQDIEKTLNAMGVVLDALTPVRNNASVAHPNEELLGRHEAQLVINAGRTVLSYLDSKLGETQPAG
ncbi:MAG: abortive infection family protein [Thermoleophilia bacterium]